MRLHYQINKRYLTTGTRQLCEPMTRTGTIRSPSDVKRPHQRPRYLNPQQVNSAPARLAYCCALHTLTKVVTAPGLHHPAPQRAINLASVLSMAVIAYAVYRALPTDFTNIFLTIRCFTPCLHAWVKQKTSINQAKSL